MYQKSVELSTIESYQNRTMDADHPVGGMCLHTFMGKYRLRNEPERHLCDCSLSSRGDFEESHRWPSAVSPATANSLNSIDGTSCCPLGRSWREPAPLRLNFALPLPKVSDGLDDVMQYITFKRSSDGEFV
jgi:hypothetical protein